MHSQTAVIIDVVPERAQGAADDGKRFAALDVVHLLLLVEKTMEYG